MQVTQLQQIIDLGLTILGLPAASFLDWLDDAASFLDWLDYLRRQLHHDRKSCLVAKFKIPNLSHRTGILHA